MGWNRDRDMDPDGLEQVKGDGVRWVGKGTGR